MLAEANKAFIDLNNVFENKGDTSKEKSLKHLADIKADVDHLDILR